MRKGNESNGRSDADREDREEEERRGEEERRRGSEGKRREGGRHFDCLVGVRVEEREGNRLERFQRRPAHAFPHGSQRMTENVRGRDEGEAEKGQKRRKERENMEGQR
eukprot:2473571-Rhodomonas_salina.1